MTRPRDLTERRPGLQGLDNSGGYAYWSGAMRASIEHLLDSPSSGLARSLARELLEDYETWRDAQ